MFSKNITIDYLGQITIELGDYFSFPANFEELFNDGDMKLSSVFEVSLLPNSFHRLNYTIEMTSYSASELQGINRRKNIGESTVKELVGSSVEQFLDSDRFKTTVKKSSHILVFKVTFDSPWYVSVNETDILQIKICKKEFGADLIQHTNSEGCLELHQYFSMQNYESEITLIFAVKVFAMMMMVILLAKHIIDLHCNSKVFPFISLILTPLIMLHVFTLDVKLTEVVKL